MGNGVAQGDVVQTELAGIDMQAAAHFARRDVDNAADRGNDS